ncbi:ATP-binding response regulator [Luteirhabdus pelagi]|uniref:ATP-binding response regulator n=1 Tax=Luteirhabdus pelagi TaxID=2792783 RepID=UPI00193A9BB0|nr:hybrid sensor histidine kinase/response regulator [Luteirhabdus pelagi]
MATFKNRFTLKVIASYVVLAAIAMGVGYVLYQEYQRLSTADTNTMNEERYFETGSLINLVYETDSFSRLALLTLEEDDFEQYVSLQDSLQQQLERLKELLVSDIQAQQLDSVQELLVEKRSNIEQLRVLKITNRGNTTLDDLLEEFKKLDNTLGRLSVETFVQNPARLSNRERAYFQSLVELINRNNQADTVQVDATVVDSMLTASRYIVNQAKQADSRARRSLEEKESQLIENDLQLSEQLRSLITQIEAEIVAQNESLASSQKASQEKTATFLKIAAIISFLVVIFFTYIVLSDFFRAERYKESLAEEKTYAESLLKSREQLMATVSHDLKTPLNTIVGYSELLEQGNLDKRNKHYVGQISDSSHYITKLVNDLLDFSKLEAGKLTVDAIPFSLENMLRKIGEAHQELFKESSVALQLNISEEIKGNTYKSDPLRLQQILNNLVGNAFKFTETGTISLSATVEALVKEEAHTIQISVSDTGPGIPRERLEDIFKEFTQIEDENSVKKEGYGLGLAISKKLATLLGGSLTVQSEVGKGTTFLLLVTLPLTENGIAQPSPSKLASATTLKAMIFDDDTAMLDMLQRLNEQLNISIETCSDGSKFDFEKVSNLDFILTDIQMPAMSGYEVLGEVKKWADIPVIAMTGNRSNNRTHYLEKGFAEVLEKPFGKARYVEALETVLGVSFAPHDPEKAIAETESTTLFDLTLLLSYMGDEAAVQPILKTFISEAKHDYKNLEASVTAEKIDEAKQHAHKMLTMTRQLQAIQVVEQLEAIEDAETSDIEFYKNQTQKLKRSLEELFSALERNMDEMS